MHKKNKSYLAGMEKRTRMLDFSKTIKKPKNQVKTDFRPHEGDRMKSVDHAEILRQRDIARMLFK